MSENESIEQLFQALIKKDKLRWGESECTYNKTLHKLCRQGRKKYYTMALTGAESCKDVTKEEFDAFKEQGARDKHDQFMSRCKKERFYTYGITVTKKGWQENLIKELKAAIKAEKEQPCK